MFPIEEGRFKIIQDNTLSVVRHVMFPIEEGRETSSFACRSKMVSPVRSP